MRRIFAASPTVQLGERSYRGAVCSREPNGSAARVPVHAPRFSSFPYDEFSLRGPARIQMQAVSRMSAMCSGTTDGFVAGENDIPLLLAAVPMPAPASTEPFTIADEGRALLVYRIAPTHHGAAGRFVSELFCLVKFDGAVFASLGPPNDEEVSSHVLHAKGLRPYAAYEVVNSTLVAEWWPNVGLPITLRHFIFTFQDSSFEAVASNCRLVSTFATSDAARREAFVSFV